MPKISIVHAGKQTKWGPKAGKVETIYLCETQSDLDHLFELSRKQIRKVYVESELLLAAITRLHTIYDVDSFVVEAECDDAVGGIFFSVRVRADAKAPKYS